MPDDDVAQTHSLWGRVSCPWMRRRVSLAVPLAFCGLWAGAWYLLVVCVGSGRWELERWEPVLCAVLTTLPLLLLYSGLRLRLEVLRAGGFVVLAWLMGLIVPPVVFYMVLASVVGRRLFGW